VPEPEPTDAGPDVFFLPLAVPDAASFGDLDAGVVARRIPDFLQQLLNHGEAGPSALIEIQTPPDEGPVRWVVLDEAPDFEAAFRLLPEGLVARAVVTGQLQREPRGMRIELHVHELPAGPGGEQPQTTTLQALVPDADPVTALRRIAERLARVLGSELQGPSRSLFTANGRAFWKYLEGLDGAALLSGELAIPRHGDGASLIRPFAEALALDPQFGWALRTAQQTMASALEGERLEPEVALAALDRCFSAKPVDGEACVAVAEQMLAMGDEARARAWLEYAAKLEPPPARALESLGILFANAGDLVRARDLWLRGVEVDGHPDFFAQLARLAFSEGHQHEGWDKVLRGLRRLYERLARASEWTDDGRGAGVLLRYLVEHLGELRPPPEVAEALFDLVGQVEEADDRIDLGLCLLAVGKPQLARAELTAGLGAGPGANSRDHALRALLALEVPDFEKRFARAVDQAASARDPRPAVAELQKLVDAQGEFWPAKFFIGVALARTGRADEALDLYADVLRLRPGQPDALGEMARLFDQRGNPKRALELVEQALDHREDDATLHGLRARFLKNLGRSDDARAAIATALAMEPDSAELRRLRRQIAG
jgi:tetratricopeptide (TPR) repeat protein